MMWLNPMPKNDLRSMSLSKNQLKSFYVLFSINLFKYLVYHLIRISPSSYFSSLNELTTPSVLNFLLEELAVFCLLDFSWIQLSNFVVNWNLFYFWWFSSCILYLANLFFINVAWYFSKTFFLFSWFFYDNSFTIFIKHF